MRGKNIPENLKFGKLLTKVLQKEYPFISNVNVDLIGAPLKKGHKIDRVLFFHDRAGA